MYDILDLISHKQQKIRRPLRQYRWKNYAKLSTIKKYTNNLPCASPQPEPNFLTCKKNINSPRFFSAMHLSE